MEAELPLLLYQSTQNKKSTKLNVSSIILILISLIGFAVYLDIPTKNTFWYTLNTIKYSPLDHNLKDSEIKVTQLDNGI